MSDPFLFAFLPRLESRFLKDFEDWFKSKSDKFFYPRSSAAVSLPQDVMGDVTRISILGVVGLTNVANIVRSWIAESVDKGGTIILRLGILLKQVAHGILSIVQRSAALNYINSTMLEVI
jgi:hypothetical protein